MITQLAQAIQLPGLNNTPVPINYPSEFKGFIFQGNQGTIGNILSTAIPLVLAFAGLGLLLMLISAGYTFLTSAGDAKKNGTGKTATYQRNCRISHRICRILVCSADRHHLWT